MNSAKKRRVSFINDEVATLSKPVISEVYKSKFYSKEGKGRGKNELPNFLVRDGGDWKDGTYRKFQPHKNHKSFMVGKIGNPLQATLPVLWNRCINLFLITIIK